MAASPLLLLFLTALVTGLLATLVVVAAVAVEDWEMGSYDLEALSRINISCRSKSGTECHVTSISWQPLLLKYEEFSHRGAGNLSHYLFATTSSLWRVCDHLTDSLRRENIPARDKSLKVQRCFTFVTDYDEQSDQMTKRSKQIARLQNSAASCYIVVLIDLISAAIVGVLGLVYKQVASCMIAGVLYLMAALFGIFGLSMFHTKDYYERYKCFSLLEIPTRACRARTVSVGSGIPLAWLGVFLCVLACLAWLFVSRVLRVIRAKTML